MGSVIHSDPEIMGGAPVFTGTRVPVKTLFDHLAYGSRMDVFIRDFPTVSLEQAVRALDLARVTLETYSYENAARRDAINARESPGIPTPGKTSVAIRDLVIHSDPEIMGGAPVFTGTRVPVRDLFDYLAKGYTIVGFLDSFDTAATQEQVFRTINMARSLLELQAYETAD